MILPIGVVSKKRTGAKRIALTSFSWKILAAIHWAQKDSPYVNPVKRELQQSMAAYPASQWFTLTFSGC